MTIIIHRLPVGWAGRFILLRLAARWRSMLTAILGVVLVAMIGASVPLYTAAIAQIGMIQRIEQQPPENMQIFTRISLRGSDSPDLLAGWLERGAEVRAAVQDTLVGSPTDWVQQTLTMGETTPMQLVIEGEDRDARLRVAYYEGWHESTYLIEGRWPRETGDQAVDLEAVIGDQAAEDLGLAIEDSLTLEQRGWESSVPVHVRIVGIVHLAESDLAVAQDALRVGRSAQGAVESNLLTTQADFVRVAAQHVPDTGTVFGWWVLFDHDALAFPALLAATDRLDAFHQRLLTRIASEGAGLNFIYRSEIIPVLKDYQGEVETLRAPFGLLLLQVGALALFFLIVTAALVRRGGRREVAMLQSRGSAHWQLIVLDGLEALMISALAAGAAPFLARWFLEWIVPTLTRINTLTLVLDRGVFGYAAGAAAVSWIMLTATLYPVLRLPLISAGGSKARSESQLWWQRYYVDVVLLVVGMAALWRLITNESPLTATQIGEIEADPLLLLAPILLFIAVGSALLRIFPHLSGLAARALAHGRRLPGALAAWQVSREPAHYGRITFLLTLAIGIGWLATSFHATLQRSQRDKAAYAVGADVRIEERDSVHKIDRTRPADFYANLPGVKAVSLAARFYIPNAGRDGRQPLSGEILAVDPDTFGTISYWRDDLGERVLPSPPETLEPPGGVLPVRPERIGLWVRVEQPQLDSTYSVPVLDDDGNMVFVPTPGQLDGRLDMWLRLRDESGTAMQIPLRVMSEPDEDGWIYLEGVLPAHLDGALRLESVYWSNYMGWVYSPFRTYRLWLADLTLHSADGEHILDDWLAGESWDWVSDTGSEFEGTNDTGPTRGNNQSRVVTWTQDGPRVLMGLMLNYSEPDPIPAIASQRFAELNGLLPGATFQLGTVEHVQPRFVLEDTVEYFPTLYPEDRLFLIVDQDTLFHALNRRPSATYYPSEVWLQLESGASSEAVVTALDAQTDRTIITRVQTIQQMREELETDILLAGLIGLLYLAFGVALVLTVISLLTYVALTAMQRRAEFGVLRALGLSAGRLVASIALEQVMVMLTGVVLGGVLGAAMSSQVLPTLAFGATGEAVTPPFVIQVEQSALIQYVALLLLVLGVTFGASLVLVRRLSLIDLLRFGEE
jgi:hypothetical protein